MLLARLLLLPLLNLRSIRTMQKQVPDRQSDKITIDTPYGTIESDSGNHFLDIATILVIISFCLFLKLKGALLLKRFIKK